MNEKVILKHIDSFEKQFDKTVRQELKNSNKK